MKRIVNLIIVLLAVMFICACNVKTGIDSKKIYNFEECRKDAYIIIESLKEKYRNLQFQDFTIRLPKENEVWPLKITTPSIEKGIPAREKLVERIKSQVKGLKEVMGEVNENDIMVMWNSEAGDGICEDTPCTQELYQKIVDGEFDDCEYFGIYWWNYEKNEDLDKIDGKEYYTTCWYDDIYYLNGKKGKINGYDEDDNKFKIVKIYDVGNENDDLLDTWNLNGVQVSVIEGIDCLYEFYEKTLDYEENKDVKKDIFRVKVCEISEGSYGYYFEVRRSYKGILFESVRLLDSDQWLQDIAEAGMDRAGKISTAYEYLNNYHYEKNGEPIKEIVSIETVFDLVSQEIGKEDKCLVTGMEFIYREKELRSGISEAIPMWSVTTISLKSGKEMIFYIDPQTGEIDYRDTGYRFTIS